MQDSFLKPGTPLIAYIGAFLIFSFLLLKFINKVVYILKGNPSRATNNDFYDEYVFPAFNALIALTIVISVPEIEPYLSLVVLGLAVIALVFKTMASQDSLNKRVTLAILVLIIVVNGPLIWNYYQNNLNGIKITAMLHEEDTFGTSVGKIPFHSAMLELWEEKMVDAFKDKYGIEVEIKGVASDLSDRYYQIKKELNETPKSEQVDVFAIDIIWPDLLAKYAEDLNGLEKNLDHKFFKAVFDHNTVDEKLVALPWYVDVGLLFYRKDLLGDKAPPETWDELETMARDIQIQERQKGNKDFWGFVWEGKDAEGLTCVALEWQASHGGGQILNKFGNEDFDIDATTKAFQRAKSWIGDISPNNITEYSGSDVLDIWRDRNALFMRHWPYAYNISVGSDNPPFKEDEIGVTLLPKDGNTKNAKHISTLGGWQLMVNKNSSRRRKQAAKKFVQFLSTDISKDTHTSPLISLIDKTRKIPALKEAYLSAEAKSKLPYISNIPSSAKDINNLALNQMFDEDIEINIVKRPSKTIDNHFSNDEKYLNVTKNYSYGVNEILSSKESFKDEAAIKAKVKDIRNKITK